MSVGGFQAFPYMKDMPASHFLYWTNQVYSDIRKKKQVQELTAMVNK